MIYTKIRLSLVAAVCPSRPCKNCSIIHLSGLPPTPIRPVARGPTSISWPVVVLYDLFDTETLALTGPHIMIQLVDFFYGNMHYSFVQLNFRHIEKYNLGRVSSNGLQSSNAWLAFTGRMGGSLGIVVWGMICHKQSFSSFFWIEDWTLNKKFLDPPLLLTTVSDTVFQVLFLLECCCFFLCFVCLFV